MNSIIPESFVFSQSSLQSYQNCRCQFYLRYVIQLQWPAPPADDQIAYERDRQAGTRFHQLIQQHIIGLAPDLLSHTAQNDPDPRMQHWYGSFLRTIAGQISGQFFPELTLQVRLGEHKLMAKYDLLAQSEDGYTIYDWKTSHKPPAPNWLASRMQSRVFPLVLATHLQERGEEQAQNIRMLYWEASEPETPYILAYSTEKQAGDRVFISDLMQRIKQSPPADFPKTENLKVCQYCYYRSYCKRGIKAGSHTETELFAPELAAETGSASTDPLSV